MGTKLVIGIVAVAAIGGAAVGLPWYSAGIVEKQFDAAFASPASDCYPLTGIGFKLGEFDRGLYSSKAVTSIVFSKGYEKALPKLLIEHQIFNFPTPARLAKVSSIFVVNGKKIDGIAPVETFLHRDGTFETVWKPGDFDQQSISKGMAKLSLKNAYIKLDKTAQGTALDFNSDRLQIDLLKLGKLAISDFSYKSDNANTPLCMKRVEAQDVFKIGGIEFSVDPLGSAELKNLVVTGVVSDKNNNIDLRSVSKFASIRATVGRRNFVKLSDFVFEMAFSRIPHSALFDHARKMDMLNIDMFALDSGAGHDKIMTLYKETGLEFFKNSLEFAFPEMAFTLDTPVLKGTLTARSQYKIEGQENWEAPVAEWLSGETEIKVSKDLLHSLLFLMLTGDYAVWPDLLRGLDLKEFSSLDSSSMPGVTQRELIAQLLAKSLIVEEIDNYKSVFTISRGGMLLNGQPAEDLMAGLLTNLKGIW